MKIIEDLKEIFQYLKHYKARTAMTMFGIIWGTLTVIVLLAFGVGVKKQMAKNMHGLGEGIAIVWPNQTSIPFEGYGRDRGIRLMPDDIELIRSEVKNIVRISPEFHKWGSVIRRGDKINRPNVTGIIPEYGIMRNIWPEPGGRWLNDLDISQKRRVVFLGNRLRDLLFGENADAIGQYIYIDEIPFLVIGVMREKVQPSSYSQRDQDRAFIPMTTHMSVFGQRYVSNFVYQIGDPLLAESVRNQVYTVLGNKFRFDPKDTETLWIWDTNEFDQFLFYFSLGFTIFMGLIGVITLVVGGIGLANIMYVVVKERTREIGIRRAVGAKRGHIMSQFIFETFIIIGLSAFIGFMLAWAITSLMAALPLENVKEAVGTPKLNITVAMITILVLSTIGFLAGYFPARKASRLDVIDCLRY
ncbi:MAG: FtsX-like permease family protein [Calditrichaeota bacterium]|nr:ABC transporter permease [Calditrichota bacterium]RQW07630.1 MAG: FtsX-like permease family protein [Calditrichota bacterium]